MVLPVACWASDSAGHFRGLVARTVRSPGRPSGAGELIGGVGVGSAAADVDQFVEALDGLLTRGPRWRYARGPNGWAPTPDDRLLPAWAASTPTAPVPVPSTPTAPVPTTPPRDP